MPLKTGGEVDSACTKCKMTLAHTILAMVGSRPVRVQCNTCGGQHNYRAPEGTPAPVKPRAASSGTTKTAERTTKTRVTFDEALGQRGGLSREYSPKTRYIVDEVLSHPVFGRGFVSAVRNDKIDVTFRAGVKTLVHGR